jgi:hypothetical protein
VNEGNGRLTLAKAVKGPIADVPAGATDIASGEAPKVVKGAYEPGVHNLDIDLLSKGSARTLKTASVATGARTSELLNAQTSAWPAAEPEYHSRSRVGFSCQSFHERRSGIVDFDWCSETEAGPRHASA